MPRIYYRRNGKLHYTTLPLRSFSLTSSPADVTIHFAETDLSTPSLWIKGRELVGRSRSIINGRVAGLLAERKAIDARNAVLQQE